jgi:Na+/H+ antiporter subunit.
MIDIAILVLVGAACAILAFCAVTALVVREPLQRLHLLAPVTTLAVPLYGLAVILRMGMSLSSATVVVIVLLVAVSGPVLSTAIGRAIAQESGMDVGRSPE